MSSAAAKAAKQTEEKIRELARKKSNKNCFDCGKSGPQNNVNLTHNTFVCTQCAGIHRHFSHVVKTINMVNFTQSEVDALETGGNKRAHKYWHGRLDETTHKLDADDPTAVKTFMEQVYKEKRWVAQEGDKLKVKPKKDKKSGLTPTHTSNASISTTPTAAAIPKKSPTPDKAAHRRDNSESTSSQQSNSQVQQPAAKPAPVHDAGIDFLSDMGSLSFESSSPSPAPAGFPSTGFGDSRAGSRRASGAGLFGVASSHIPTTRYATPQAQIMAALQQTATDWGLTPDVLQQHTAQALQTYMHQHTTTQTSQPTSQHRSNGHVAVNTNDDVFADIGQEDSGNPFADDDDDDDDGPFGAAPAPTQPTAPTHLSSPAANVMMSSPTHTYTSPQATPFGTTSPQPNYYTSPQQGFGQQPGFAATPQGYPPSMAQAQPFPPQGFPQQQPFPGQGYGQPYQPQGYGQYPNPAFASLGPTVPLTTSVSAPTQPAKPAANNNLFSNLNPLDGF